MPAFLLGRGEPLVIVELGDPLLECIAAGKLGQEGVGDAVLGIDPGAHLRIVAHVILEPAIGIRDRRPELGFDEVDAFGRRISDRCRRSGRLGRAAGIERDHGNGRRKKGNTKQAPTHFSPPKKKRTPRR